MNPSIFISHSWVHSSTVDIIDEDFRSIGINIIRVVRDLGCKDNVKDYKKRIRETDCSLISNAYLKSKNWLCEIVEFAKEINYHHEMLPILLDGCKIFHREDKIACIKYWDEQI